jgi:hypothetical protein
MLPSAPNTAPSAAVPEKETSTQGLETNRGHPLPT